MKRSFLSFAFVACLFSLPASADEPSKQDGFTSLFDGKTLTGWRNAYDWGKIDIVNGEIHLTGEKKFFVVTEKNYVDFVFEGDIFLPEGKANSGFMFRAHVDLLGNCF
jgi:hypothetical protein